MKELTFKEVIENIKEGQVWESKYTTIKVNNEGVLLINDNDYLNNNDVNILKKDLIAINIYSKFKLKRKQHRFG
ncbi:TPA: hypothetical protein I9Z35_000465 [Clostridium perfringens]|nr:hypothetical protein [Clostridium perfringens]